MKIMTLFGPEEATKKCNTCDQIKPLEEFYNESASRSRHNEQRRNQCKVCWNKFNGRHRFSNVATFEVK